MRSFDRRRLAYSNIYIYINNCFYLFILMEAPSRVSKLDVRFDSLLDIVSIGGNCKVLSVKPFFFFSKRDCDDHLVDSFSLAWHSVCAVLLTMSIIALAPCHLWRRLLHRQARHWRHCLFCLADCFGFVLGLSGWHVLCLLQVLVSVSPGGDGFPR